jgi:hypothetical protein
MSNDTPISDDLDALIVGAGFAGESGHRGGDIGNGPVPKA